MKRFSMLFIVMSMIISSSYIIQGSEGIDPWFEDDYNEAENVKYIIPESFDYLDLKSEITRGEFCEVLVLSYRALGNTIPKDFETQVFSDTDGWYINIAYQLGFVSGFQDGTFRETNYITRQEMFKMINNFMEKIEVTENIDDEQIDRILSEFSDSSQISSWALKATALVKYMGIVNGTERGTIDPLSNTSRVQGVVLVNRMINFVSAEKVVLADATSKNRLNDLPENDSENVEDSYHTRSTSQNEDANPLYQLGYNNDKVQLVFGDQGVYQSEQEASPNMINVTVNVWTIDSYGNKYPTTRTIKINKAVEPMVMAIFEEIFNGDEKFPIKNVSGYAWRSNSTSEHRLGLAIDINPNENYMIRSSGSIVAGSYWKPGDDPYSITENGNVVNAFKKYGFDWGGTAWRSGNDYMHFSYFGN